MNNKVEIIKRPIEEAGSNLKKIAWTSIFESLFIIILGLLLIIWPTTIMKIIAYVVGSFFVIKGGYRIISYFASKGINDFFNNELLFGVVDILIGITVVVLGPEIANLFSKIVGIFMIYEALVKINMAIKLNHVHVSSWKAIAIIAVAMLLLGFFVAFCDGSALILVGVLLLIDGIIGVISDAMFMQNIDKITSKISDFVDKM